jgi:phosphonate transport system substrate-binding protein
VRQGRLELPRYFYRQPLKLVRLPIPPLPRKAGLIAKGLARCQTAIITSPKVTARNLVCCPGQAYTPAMRGACIALLLMGCQSQTGSGGPEGGTEKPEKLVLGVAPYFAEADMRREYDQLTAYLGQALDTPVELKVADSYAALPGLLQAFDVHLAILPPFAYVQAKRDNPGLVLVATAIADGSSTYASFIVARDDSGIGNVEQLRGKRFAFVDRHSTSGYLYPLAYLRSLDMEPRAHFGSVQFAGDHAKLIDMVLRREVDAGATFSTAFKLAAAEHPDGQHLRVVAKTGRIPWDAYCVSPRLASDVVTRLRSALLALSPNTEDGRKVLSGLSSISGFVAVGDDHYDEVRRVARFVENGR